MSEKTTDQDNDSGTKEQTQPEDLFDATRKLADKTEQYFTEAAAKFQNSETFGKLTDAFKNAGDFMEEISDQFNKSDWADKLDALKDKTVIKTDKLIQKAKEAGKDIAEEIDEAIDRIVKNLESIRKEAKKILKTENKIAVNKT